MGQACRGQPAGEGGEVLVVRRLKGCLCLSEQDLEEILPESLQLSGKSIGKRSPRWYTDFQIMSIAVD